MSKASIVPVTGCSVRQAFAAFDYIGAIAQASWELLARRLTPETNARLTDARDTFYTVRDTEEECA